MTDPDCSDPAAPAGVRSAEYALEDLPAGLGRAEFRMTLACAGPPRATVVLVPGSNCDGRELADDPAWQAWAAARGLALLGVWLQDPPDSPEPWIEAYSRAERGSGECLERAVCELAARLGAGDLGGKPLAIVGSSAGGQFAYEFACWRPARVLAFVAHKGGVYFTHLAPPEARALPGLFFIGGLDSLHRRLSLTGVWSMGRRAGACWALVDPSTTAGSFTPTGRFPPAMPRRRSGKWAAGCRGRPALGRPRRWLPHSMPAWPAPGIVRNAHLRGKCIRLSE